MKKTIKNKNKKRQTNKKINNLKKTRKNINYNKFRPILLLNNDYIETQLYIPKNTQRKKYYNLIQPANGGNYIANATNYLGNTASGVGNAITGVASSAYNYSSDIGTGAVRRLSSIRYPNCNKFIDTTSGLYEDCINKETAKANRIQKYGTALE